MLSASRLANIASLLTVGMRQKTNFTADSASDMERPVKP